MYNFLAQRRRGAECDTEYIYFSRRGAECDAEYIYFSRRDAKCDAECDAELSSLGLSSQRRPERSLTPKTPTPQTMYSAQTLRLCASARDKFTLRLCVGNNSTNREK
mgnify:CR=1 FL=1